MAKYSFTKTSQVLISTHFERGEIEALDRSWNKPIEYKIRVKDQVELAEV